MVIRSRKARPVCEGCGGPVWSKGSQNGLCWWIYRRSVGLCVLRWRKRRWTCPNLGV